MLTSAKFTEWTKKNGQKKKKTSLPVACKSDAMPSHHYSGVYTLVSCFTIG